MDQTGAFFVGLLAGPVCYFGAQLKHYIGYDDALDAFGVHAVGGILGGILTGFFATATITGDVNGVFYADTEHGGRQLGIQLYAITFSVFWSLFLTFFIVLLVDFTLGLRVSELEEDLGLDHTLHGETLIVSTTSEHAKVSLVEERKRDFASTSVDITNHSSTVQTISAPPLLLQEEP